MAALNCRSHLPTQGDIELRSVADEGAWEACRRNQIGATPFHRWSWLLLMAESFQCDFVPVGIFYHGVLIGLLPLLVRHRGPYSLVNQTPFPYLGPLIPSTFLPAGLQSLTDYRRRHHRFAAIRHSWAPGSDANAEFLVHDGFDIHIEITMTLSLEGRTHDQMWSGLSRKRRWTVRRARDADITVHTATEGEVKRELPNILHDISRHRRVRSHYPRSTFGLLWDRYHNDTDVYMRTARLGGQPAAVMVTIRDGDCAYLWCGGQHTRYRALSPDSLITWDALSWAHEQGCASVDMVGTVDPGIALFKASFGAIQAPYIVADRLNIPGIDRARRLYARIRGLSNAAVLLR